MHQLAMHADVAVVHCRGRIIAGQIDELRDLVLSAIHHNHQVVLNLAEVSDVDSLGLGMLAFVCITARKRGLDVKLVAPSQYVADVLETTMLGTVFMVYATDETAMAAFATK